MLKSITHRHRITSHSNQSLHVSGLRPDSRTSCLKRSPANNLTALSNTSLNTMILGLVKPHTTHQGSRMGSTIPRSIHHRESQCCCYYPATKTVVSTILSSNNPIKLHPSIQQELSRPYEMPWLGIPGLCRSTKSSARNDLPIWISLFRAPQLYITNL